MNHALSLFLTIVVTFLLIQTGLAQSGHAMKSRQLAIKYIDHHASELASLSDSIWAYAEPSFKEVRSSKLLIEFLKKEGFTIQERVSGFETVFIASYGNEKPVIGLFGEYDADANASNKVVPRQEEIGPGKYGHGGGHNLLGVGSLGAALAIKKLIESKRLSCTIRYYGTTAEGEQGSKTYLARDGYFNDLDISLYWHPAPATVAPTAPWDALIDLEVKFTGPKTNIIQDKNSTATTSEAREQLIGDLQSLRPQFNAGKKLNYSLYESPHTLNESPDTVRIAIRIQCTEQVDAVQLFERISSSVNGIREQMNVTTTLKVKRAFHQFLPNVKAMEVVHKNLEWLGPISYTAEEQQFVRELQQHLGYPANGIEDKLVPFTDNSSREQLYGYGSDIGDASWIAPEIYFVVRSLPGVPMHRWPGTIFTGHSIGHKGIIQASKAMALTIIDYVENPKLQKIIRDDFEVRRGSYRYQSILDPGLPDITKFEH